jgi:hypothetical protein
MREECDNRCYNFWLPLEKYAHKFATMHIFLFEITKAVFNMQEVWHSPTMATTMLLSQAFSAW